MTASTWHDAPLVVIAAVRCPHCDSTARPILVRTEAAGDGAVFRRAICKRCSRKFWTCVDPEMRPVIIPGVGKAGLDVP